MTPATCRFPSTISADVAAENMEFHPAPRATGLCSHFRINFDNEFYHAALSSKGTAHPARTLEIGIRRPLPVSVLQGEIHCAPLLIR